MQQDNFDGFDFARDVIGDDLVVGSVAYSSREWESDGEGGVQRRSTHPNSDLDRVTEYENRMGAEFISRAAKIGTEFAALVENISAGPKIATLLREHAELLVDVEDRGFDSRCVERTIHSAFDRVVADPTTDSALVGPESTRQPSTR